MFKEREDIIIIFVLHDTTHRNSKKKIVLEKIIYISLTLHRQ